MTLAILDDLTPGNLTGGTRVAVTGTIDAQGDVGEIGGINQKAVAARAAGARLFIVPACSRQDPPAALQACQQDLSRAVQRAGSKVKVVPVSTFAQALQALRGAGGDPVVTTTTAPRAT
jgi:PDZ domain-containing protein